MKFVAVDPGKATGIAVFDDRDGNPIRWRSFEASPWTRAADDIREVAAGAVDLFVVEQFTITARTIKSARQYEAMKLIGVIEWMAEKANIPVVFQMPAAAKSFVTDAKLKRLDLYTPGPDHPNDAMRHAVMYAAKNNLLTTEEKHAIANA